MSYKNNKDQILTLLRQNVDKKIILDKYNIPLPILLEWDSGKDIAESTGVEISDLNLDEPDTELEETLKIAANKIANSFNDVGTIDEGKAKTLKHMADSVSVLYKTFCFDSDSIPKGNTNFNVFLQQMKP